MKRRCLCSGTQCVLEPRTGYISIATGGNYIFTLNSDEGSRFLGILKSLSW